MIEQEMEEIEKQIEDLSPYIQKYIDYHTRNIKYIIDYTTYREDLKQEVIVYMLKALSKYNSEQSKFTTYIYKGTMQCIINYLREIPKADIIEYKNEHDAIAPNTLNDVELSVLSQQIQEILRKTLKPRSHAIINMYYGLNGFNPTLPRKIAKIYNVSEQFIKIIIKNNLKKLRKPFEECGIDLSIFED